MAKTKEAKSNPPKSPDVVLQETLTDPTVRRFFFRDCNSYKELADAIEANPTFKIISKVYPDQEIDFNSLPKGGLSCFPVCGITELIDLDKLEDPKGLYVRAKKRFRELYKQTPFSISLNFPDKPCDGLEYIVMTCRAGEAIIEYTAPMQTGQWAEIFSKSEGTIRKWIKRKDIYHFQQVSDRLYRLPKKEAPPDYYLEKFDEMIKEQAQKIAKNSERKP
jgi:hypothetical protein